MFQVYSKVIHIHTHICVCVCVWISVSAHRLKRLPAMRETWVPSLGWEGPLEKEMASHSSILAWRIPWAEEPGGDTHTHIYTPTYILF